MEMEQGKPNYQSKEIYSQAPSQQLDGTQLHYLLDSGDMLSEVESYLRGVRYNPMKGEVMQLGDPLMNEKGINKVMRDLRLHCDKMFSLSKLSQEEVTSLTLEFAGELNLSLHINANDFQMQHHKIGDVIKTVVRCMFVTLKKSQDGNFQEFFRGNFKTIETTTRDDKSRWRLFKRN